MAGLKDMTWHIGSYEEALADEVEKWHADAAVDKLWQKDSSLWTGNDEDKWLGWLDSIEWMQSQIEAFTEFALQVKADGFTDVIVLGMGGSSLCPEVLAMSFGQQPGWPKLHVLDSTVPQQVKRFRDAVDLSKTLCVVASKSGTTTEPNTFCDYYWNEMRDAVGDQAGNHFVAITDPGSALQTLADKNRFRKTFLGRPEIGGRFSALSPFGLVPAALMGIDLKVFLDHAEKMAERCKLSASENPGVILGLLLGLLAKSGKDKVTLVSASKIWDFGAWLEQLIAESTGKDGVGIIPVDLEPLSSPDTYGDDRVFVQVRLTDDPTPDIDAKLKVLTEAGHPVVHIDAQNEMALGAEFFRWEIATAVAGSVLGIHPFNQPNVQESKDFTAKLTSAYEETGALPKQIPALNADGMSFFVDENNQEVIGHDLDTTIKNHLNRLKPGDYVAICAYLDMTDETVEQLATLRKLIRDKFKVATTLGFGPRFLHSTGQLHKGGANNVVVLQLAGVNTPDLDIPGRSFSFGILKDAQALGDASALSMRQRRVLRVLLSDGLLGGINRLYQAAERI